MASTAITPPTNVAAMTATAVADPAAPDDAPSDGSGDAE